MITRNSSDKIIGIKRYISFAPAMAAALMVLSGCGSSEDYDSKLVIDSEGMIESIIYEEFAEAYYDENELSDMASEEISYYNSEYITPKISLEETTFIEDESIIKLVMDYDSYSDYSHFNQVSFFYGTVEEALDKGYEIADNLLDDDGDSFDKSDISDYYSRHIVISSEKTRISVPYNISYFTNGTVVTGKKTADFSYVTADTVQLILAK